MMRSRRGQAEVPPERVFGRLRSRGAGELGESIFLDKGDLWAWAQRSGWALPADDDDDATGDDEGSPSSADEPDDAAPTSEHHYYRLCIEHHNRLDASRVEARAPLRSWLACDRSCECISACTPRPSTHRCRSSLSEPAPNPGSEASDVVPSFAAPL